MNNELEMIREADNKWQSGKRAWSQAEVAQEEAAELEVDFFLKMLEVNMNYKQAAQGFAEAAGHGHYRAINDLAKCFRQGKGVRKSFSLSFDHKFKAAKMKEDMKELRGSNVKYVNFS